MCHTVDPGRHVSGRLTSFLVRASAGPDPDLASIDAYIEKEMREVHIPGLALGIVHNDEVVHLRGFGETGPGGRAVAPQTPFILASASKSGHPDPRR
jgi:CubicO group peptidase (beta-lactamase class C family)